MKKDKSTKDVMDSDQLTVRCEEVADILKALSNPDRLKLMCALWDGEKTVGELEVYAGVSQSLVSQFLRRLKLEGIVSSRKEGVFVYYQIADERVRQLVQSLYAIFCGGK
jgi:ArsR family transcriptional regulator, virulence genes transcriptional regulator